MCMHELMQAHAKQGTSQQYSSNLQKPASVRGHGFVLDYYIVVISMKLVERKQEKIGF